MDIKEKNVIVNQGEKPDSLQTKIALLPMNHEQLQAELEKFMAELQDLEDLRHGVFGQTGVHVGMRVLKSARRQFEQEEVRLKERIALLQKLLHGNGRITGIIS